MMARRALIVLLWLCALIPQSLFAQQQVDGVITGGNVRPLTVAAPDFQAQDIDANLLALEINKIVFADLSSTGLFFLIPTEKITVAIGAFEEPVDFDAWKDLTAEVLLKGSIENKGEDKFEVKFRMYDVLAGKEIGEGVKLMGPKAEMRRMGHKIADALYSAITGEGGYFDSRIVFISKTGLTPPTQTIAVSDSDGANFVNLTNGTYNVLSPRFAPNNRDIIFTTFETGSPRVVELNTTTGVITPLVSLDGFSFAPEIAPDGRFALASQTDSMGNTNIVRIDLTTKTIVSLTQTPSIETSPSISPDGLQYVYESNQTGLSQIYTASTSGGSEKLISSGVGRYITPVWSPKGDLIAFTKIIDGGYHIGVMNVDGTQERLLTSSFVDEAPAWSPNGNAIVFYRKPNADTNETKLYSISLAGRNMMAIPTPEFAVDPSWSGLLE